MAPPAPHEMTSCRKRLHAGSPAHRPSPGAQARLALSSRRDPAAGGLRGGTSSSCALGSPRWCWVAVDSGSQVMSAEGGRTSPRGPHGLARPQASSVASPASPPRFLCVGTDVSFLHDSALSPGE